MKDQVKKKKVGVQTFYCGFISTGVNTSLNRNFHSFKIVIYIYTCVFSLWSQLFFSFLLLLLSFFFFFFWLLMSSLADC